MRENDIIKELKRSIDRLLPVPSLNVFFEKERLQGWDLLIKADYQGLCFNIIAEVVSHNSLPVFKKGIDRLKSSVHEENAVPVMVAPYLSPERQAVCRESDVYFFDLSGNVFIAYESFYVERIGFPNRYPERRQRRYPFSDKASLILREMLNKPEQSWGIRELAKKIELDPGYVSRMAKSLVESGYAVRVNGKLGIRSPKEILDDWVRVYDLKRNEHHRFFILESNAKLILRRLKKINMLQKCEYALSAQAGAGLIAPHAVYKEVHLYVSNGEGIKFLKKELDLEDADQGANLVLMRPYYKHSVFYGSRVVDGLKVVSDIQLYLDLYRYPVRGREQAEHLYDKRLERLFSGRVVND